MNEEEEKKIAHESKALEQNTILANERTYAAWIRTGLTTFATSLAIEPLLVGQAPRMALAFISMLLALTSALFFYIAAWRYLHIGVRIEAESISSAPIHLLTAVSVVFVLIALAVSIYMSVKITGV